jgi:hypothetical protein
VADLLSAAGKEEEATSFLDFVRCFSDATRRRDFGFLEALFCEERDGALSAILGPMPSRHGSAFPRQDSHRRSLPDAVMREAPGERESMNGHELLENQEG